MTITTHFRRSKSPRAVKPFRIGVRGGITGVRAVGDSANAGLIFIREDGITT